MSGSWAQGPSQWPLGAPESLFGREGSSSIQGARVFGNILENGVTCVLFSTMSISGKGNGGGGGSRKRG